MKLLFSYKLRLDEVKCEKEIDIDDSFKRRADFSQSERSVYCKMLFKYLNDIRLTLLKEYFDDDFEEMNSYDIEEYFDDCFEYDFNFDDNLFSH